ncbi:MAG: hypothetical protein OHK0024_01710 [Thalassobaculales bacterium]
MDDTAAARPAGVEAYKAILRDLLDRRPSGTRQRLAAALGTNRSFISQISNPAYPVPIPAQHLPMILEICHPAPAERAAFLEAYARAHPGRLAGLPPDRRLRTVSVHVPDLQDSARNQAVDRMLADFVARLSRFVEELDGGEPPR